MNNSRIFGGIVARLTMAAMLLFGLAGTASASLVFDFSNVTNAQFVFDGGTNTFSFPNVLNTVDFSVTNQSGSWPGSVLNYTGDFVGSWTVSDIGNPAAVSGMGSLTIKSSDNSTTLSGDLIWVTIGTLGSVGGLNLDSVLNFSNFTLIGTDANLQSLASAGSARITVSFQNIQTGPPANQIGEGCSGDLLGQLRCGGISTGSYSGTLTAEPNAIPEPGTMLLSAVALLGLGLLRRRAA